MTGPRSELIAQRFAATARWIGRSRVVGWIVVVVFVVQFLWLFENYRGARAVAVELALLKAQGESLTWDPSMLHGPVPDAENFCAVPCLRGALDEGEAARDRDIPGMEGLRFRYDWGNRNRIPTSYQTFITLKRKVPVISWLYVPGSRDEIDWWQWRRALMWSGYFPMITDDVADEWAVLRGLDRLEPMFASLAEAAARKYAVFLPAPRERWNGGPPQLDDSDARVPLHRVLQILSLRARSAMACGDGSEAARMLRIIRRLGEAMENEYGLGDRRVALVDLYLEGLTLHSWTEDVLDEYTSALTADGQAGILRRLRREMLYDCTGCITVGKNWFTRFVDQRHPWFFPQGWADHGRAVMMRTYRQEMLEPLKSGGIPALMGSEDGFLSEQENFWVRFQQGGLPGFRDERPTTGMVKSEMLCRLCVMAGAAEKFRLRHGYYPPSAEGLHLPGAASQWLDYDGKPLRYLCSEDGRRAVVYSIAKNAVDDWHGQSPPKLRPEDGSKVEPGSGLTLPGEKRDIVTGYRDLDWLVALEIR